MTKNKAERESLVGKDKERNEKCTKREQNRKRDTNIMRGVVERKRKRETKTERERQRERERERR